MGAWNGRAGVGNIRAGWSLAMSLDSLVVMFSFFFVDLFGALGTLIGDKRLVRTVQAHPLDHVHPHGAVRRQIRADVKAQENFLERVSDCGCLIA